MTAPAPHPLRAEARGSVAPWAGLAVFLTLAAAMAVKADRWQGSWGETSLALHAAATLLGGPLAAAIGCWHGGRERRSRTADLWLSAARSALAQFVVAALPVVLAVVLGYALAAAGALLASAPYVSAGRPLVLPVVADAVFLAATVAVAMAVGRWVRWRPAAPVLAGLTYLALSLSLDRGSAARFLSPAVDGGIGEALPAWWQPVAMAGWTGGLAVVVVVTYAARRARGRWAALLPLTAAVCAAVVLVQAGERAWRPDPAAGRQVCDGGSPQVCVNALEEDLLPQVSRALSGITGRLAGVPDAPVRFEDLPRGTHRDEAELPQLLRGRVSYGGDWPTRNVSPGRPRQGWRAAATAAVRPRSCASTKPYGTGWCRTGSASAGGRPGRGTPGKGATRRPSPPPRPATGPCGTSRPWATTGGVPGWAGTSDRWRAATRGRFLSCDPGRAGVKGPSPAACFTYLAASRSYAIRPPV
ncbi:hypothetical protein OEIGOIKO_03845 [Streptomyces chrestomyceticus JCM 4735]|uniref:Uncharacterized protein n=1 Tax=Streptomyces chrestomyceticus JCM 4735 TaxID=1306181 RepID=A0A7U9KVD3_9ACTN|nr:hypothetical protein [Streptomyces chrestomyceticus]GCD36090.1 hypothetical protein OEIGOIKO_03845 [Streptomyces chrestomyceticus JCM 4735]